MTVQLDAMPDPPLRSEGQVAFSNKMEPFLIAIPPLITQLNAMAVELNALAAAAGYADGAALIAAFQDGIHAATGKTTPVDADEIPIVDSAASWVLKKLTWANLKATLFGSPTLTGTPVAPTPGNTVNNTQIATTAFVRNIMPGSQAANGYRSFPDGTTIQWGVRTCSATPGAAVAFTWPIQFTAVYVCVASGVTTSTTSNSAWVDALTVNGGNIHGTLASQAACFIAVGYITPA